MAIKNTNVYRVRLQEVQLKDGLSPENALAFEFENHDNIFEIISKIQQSKSWAIRSRNCDLFLGHQTI